MTCVKCTSEKLLCLLLRQSATEVVSLGQVGTIVAFSPAVRDNYLTSAGRTGAWTLFGLTHAEKHTQLKILLRYLEISQVNSLSTRLSCTV